MSIQYSDSTFGPIIPIEDAKRLFDECIENGVPVQALHVGTESELISRKNDIIKKQELQKHIDDLKQKHIDDLKKRIKDMENLSSKNLSSKNLHIPTSNEILKIMKEHNEHNSNSNDRS
jgi:hypothetical protein